MNDLSPRQHALARWQHDRFGLFIHWGLYALPARHEWVKSREFLTDEHYQRYFDHFDPDLYDPYEWARAARYAGMRYAVLTTKHHEGFCLWDTQQTDYKSTNTPCGRDLVREYVDAFRAEGLRIGFYHSLIDWHHPHFTTDRHHPRRNDDSVAKADAQKDLSQYTAYLHAQVDELMTQYGEIDVVFYDFSYPDKGRDAWDAEKLMQRTRELQPQILINDRLDLRDVPDGYDFITPEQFMMREQPTRDGKPVPWETCQTFSGSWGYHRDESSWKSVTQLLKLLIDTVSKGGNLLLNVGPTARGTFDDRAMDRLAGMGDWIALHSRAIYGCTSAPSGVPTPQDCRLTYSPETNRLYVHVFSWPPTGELHLDGLADKVAYAQLLNDASEVSHYAHWAHRGDVGEGVLSLRVPVQQPAVVPVIELFLK
jgi:alpha-L-fucosidase